MKKTTVLSFYLAGDAQIFVLAQAEKVGQLPALACVSCFISKKLGVQGQAKEVQQILGESLENRPNRDESEIQHDLLSLVLFACNAQLLVTQRSKNRVSC